MKMREFKRGMFFRMDGDIWQIVQMELRTPGNLGSLYQVDMKNLLKGNVLRKRMSPTDELEDVYLETKEMEYLYKQGPHFVFMDSETYDQIQLAEDQVGSNASFLRLNEVVKVQFFDGQPVVIELPAAVVLEVTHTEPGARGNTVSNISKPATLETGVEIKVPNHVNIGDKVKVDTRSGEFISRA